MTVVSATLSASASTSSPFPDSASFLPAAARAKLNEGRTLALAALNLAGSGLGEEGVVPEGVVVEEVREMGTSR